LLSLVFISQAYPLSAQESQREEQDRKEALQLYQQNRLEDALPLLEQLSTVRTNDPAIFEALGACLFAHAVNLPDPEARKAMRVRARKAFLRAKELGDRSNYLVVALDQIPEDGGDPVYSSRKDVDDAMRAAEAAYGRGDFADALAGYTRVLVMDPKNYDAALFSGDVCFKQKDYDESYKWFQMAVAIDPDRETAYRYWGDSLSAAGRTADARDKLIQAFVASPYERLPRIGLMQWAQRNGVTLTQPKIDSPNSISTNGNQTRITIDPNMLGKKDGTESWMLYEITRAAWNTAEFHKEFPNEKEYRHSLAEESQALGLVANAVSEHVEKQQIKSADLNPQLAVLIKLKNEGLLESYILLAKADQGIAQDYSAYRKDHRDKLVQYMNEYVVPAPPAMK
jgi:tetratricopeptide (TPR) repeat protein